MNERALVLDANILIRAVLGRRARQLIRRYAASIDFFAPDSAFAEAEEHLPPLCATLGLNLDAVRLVYDGVSRLVQELPMAALRARASGCLRPGAHQQQTREVCCQFRGPDGQNRRPDL